jgi:hypothetical protein
MRVKNTSFALRTDVIIIELMGHNVNFSIFPRLHTTWVVARKPEIVFRCGKGTKKAVIERERERDFNVMVHIQDILERKIFLHEANVMFDVLNYQLLIHKLYCGVMTIRDIKLIAKFPILFKNVYRTQKDFLYCNTLCTCNFTFCKQMFMAIVVI